MDEDLAISAPLIQHYEQCRLSPYPDANDVPTIGWGNTIYRNGDKVTLDDVALTQEEADVLFVYWLGVFSAGVAKHTPGAKPNELAAFTSLAYNIGIGAFAGSSALRAYLAADKTTAGADIEMWNQSGGRVLLGLQRRRRAEHYVFDGSAPQVAWTQAESDFPE